MPRVEPPGQGVGAWMWVNRDGSMAVVDMDLAGFTLISLESSPSLIRGWAIGVFRIRVRVFFSGFARSFYRSGASPGFTLECFRQGHQTRVLRVATHPRLASCPARTASALGDWP